MGSGDRPQQRIEAGLAPQGLVVDILIGGEPFSRRVLVPPREDEDVAALRLAAQEELAAIRQAAQDRSVTVATYDGNSGELLEAKQFLTPG